MKAVVNWVDNVQFEGVSGTGHKVSMDGPEASGGVDAGSRPMELLLMGIGGCSSYDVIGILKKTRQKVSDCKVEIEAERADAVPAVFTKIHLHFIVSGEDLKATQVRKAVELSAEKYCSASIMMQAAGVEISHSHEIHNI